MIMRQLTISLALVLFFASTSPSQEDLQAKLRYLKVGKTDLSQIRITFGEPDSVEEITSWVKGESTTRRVAYHQSGSQLARNLPDNPVRKLSKYSFTKLGLVFYFFDNPSELHSFEITNRLLWSNGVRVGDSLIAVEKLFGTKGEWWSSDSSQEWNLEFNRMGVRFTFSREPKLPKYPMRLKRRAWVTSIEVFDKRARFS